MIHRSSIRRRGKIAAGAVVLGAGLLVTSACTPEEMAAYQQYLASQPVPTVASGKIEPVTTTTTAPPPPPTTSAPAPSAPAAAAPDVVRLLNADRAGAGLAPLAEQGTLVAKAQAWADHLATTGALSHSTITDGVDPGWWLLGENVGMGASASAVESAFMQSTAHRANILNGQYNAVGTGSSLAANGTLFVVQVFAQY